MTSMRTFKAVVKNRRLVIDEVVDEPDGTEFELELVDDLDDAERAERDVAIEKAWQAYKAGGPSYSAEEVLARLRADK